MDILIIKLGAAGDVLRTTCVLQGLREQHPRCRITWLTKESALPLLENNPFIDELIAFERAAPAKYDLLLSLDEDEAACRFASVCRKLGGELKGFFWENGFSYTPEAKPWYLMSALGPKPMNDVLKRRNTKTYQRHMIGICGLHPGAYDTLYFMTDEERAIADDFKRKHNLAGYVIGLNTGAGNRWSLKRLSISKTVRLAEALSGDATIVLFGGPEEEGRNREILSKARCRMIDAGTNNPVRTFAALLSAVDLLVTSDSLALHLGIALKRKIVAFFGPTSAAEIELYGLGEKVIPESQCYCCYKKTEFKGSCIEAISAEMIEEAVRRVMGP